MKNAATWYRRSGTALLAWALAACGAAGQTITNGSFEAQGFGVSPGYISLNSEITGWSGSPTDRVGLNPAGGTNALANNGVIPQGTNVAFIQGTSVLSTTIADLTPGQQYKVDFRINAKLTNLPVLRLAIDGAPLMNLSCTNVTGSNPYRYAAVAFTASAASHTLSMTNDAATNTVMVDDFTVAAYTDGWSYAIWTNDATTGISSTNNVTHAYNFGGTVASNTTINGVFFRGIAGVNPYASNSFTTAGFGSQYTSDDPNNITTNAGGSAALGRRFVYGGNPGAITLNGLVPGQEYVATLYTVGWEVGQRAQTLSRGTDRLTVNQDHYGNNIGLRILYRYIAPSNGTVALSQSPLASASSLHLYGLANFEAGTNVLPIVSAPRSLAGAPGLPAVFTVAGGGAQPLFYQWLKEGSPLTDQTNRILTLAAIADGDLGAYAAIVSNAYGVVTSSVASLTYAATIANPSFEADTFHNAPGYISSNTPISGWTANNPARSGLNPLIDGNSPFANNGTIPDGAQVAFLQSGSPSSALSTAISGLTIGNTYRLNFRANARASSGTAIMRVALDGTRYVDAAVTSAGNLYKPVAFEFTAAGTSMVLAVSNDQALATDSALLLDDFRLDTPSGKWSVGIWTDDVTFAATATSSYSHAYRFNSAAGVTINGVRLLGIAGGNPQVAGLLASAGFQSTATDAGFDITGAGAQLTTFVHGGTSQSLTLTNLKPGVEYELSLYSVGFDSPGARVHTFGVGTDRITVDQALYGNNKGLRISYRYTADGSGSIKVDVQQLSAGSFHLYAMSNRELTYSPWTYLPWGDDASSGVTPQSRHTHAYTFGTASREYLNQVLFAGVTGANPSVAGKFATAGMPDTVQNDPNNLAGVYMSRLIANDFAYGASNETLTLSGLTPGTDYLLTFFSVGNEAENRRVLFTAGSDSLVVNQNHYGNNNGLTVRYRYTAGPSGTLAVTMTAQDVDGNNAARTFHGYGFANREANSTAAPFVLYLSPDQWVGAGDTATFAVTNGGTGPFAYQWRKGGSDLTDQTNAVLNLSNAAPADVGAYDVVIVNGSGAVTSDTVALDVGVHVDNPSFEADTFTGGVGYVYQNFAITAWTSSPSAGLNPLQNGTGPFMNNLMIPPNGRQACFIQLNSVLMQVVTNLTPGKNYYLKFYENARRQYGTATLSVRAEGLTVVPTHSMPPDPPTLFQGVTSVNFLATSSSGVIEFVKGTASGDATLLLDLVAVLEYPATAPGITGQPQPASQWLVPGETLTLTSAATGSYPLVFQWRRNGSDLSGQNGTSLVLTVSAGDAGDYDVVVTNDYGAVTSTVASVAVGGAFSGLFNTGIDSNGTLAAGGSVDVHYQLVSSVDTAFPGPAAIVLLDAPPVGGAQYLANGPSSKWISPRSNGLTCAVGLYVYRTEFVIDSVNATGAVLTGSWSSDNLGLDIRLNGVSLGITNGGVFQSLHPFVISNGLVAGVNQLEFVISNAPPAGPTAFRAELRGVGTPLPAGPPVFLVQPTNLLVQDGQPAQFSAMALGAGPLTYQWFNDGIPLDETNRTYVIPSAGEPLQGTYWVVVTNPDGVSTSDVVTLSVNQAPTVSNSTASTTMDHALVLDQAKLLLYVYDPDGDTNLSVIAAGPTSTNGGTVTLGATNVTYTPPTGYTGTDLFAYVVSDGHGATATGVVEVTITSGVAPSMNIVAGPAIVSNNFVVRFAGVPGYTYGIEATPALVSPSWSLITNLLAPTNDQGFGVGIFQFVEPTGAYTVRYYRTVGPP